MNTNINTSINIQQTHTYNGGENYDLHSTLHNLHLNRVRDRAAYHRAMINDMKNDGQLMYMRVVGSAADRQVLVYDELTHHYKSMLMFGSNNYLGLANDPAVVKNVRTAIQEYGVGVGGPPLLNGYTVLHQELERRLAALKSKEDAVLFSSGYAANVGLVSGLLTKESVLIYDAYSHASLYDGLRLSGARSFIFPHNNMAALEARLRGVRSAHDGDVFVAVEGLYSMDGDSAPLDQVVAVCKEYGAMLMVDDAHGTGVCGAHGEGSAEAFGVSDDVDIVMGTFSKTFAVSGGFVAADKDLVSYLRYYARSHMFSAALSQANVAAVLAGLTILENEPERISRLRDRSLYARTSLARLGFNTQGTSPIIPLIVPVDKDMRRIAQSLHADGIFVNSVEYPAVPISQQRFRISIMSTHTEADIDRLYHAIEKAWNA